MSIDPRTDIFLARALEAVEEAAEARGRVARAQWLKIAEAYRELAQPAVGPRLVRDTGKQESR
jgi:hypothetical protein